MGSLGVSCVPNTVPSHVTDGQKKKIFVGAAVAILCIVIVVVAVVITRPKAAVVLPQTNVQEGEPKSVDECLTLYRKAPSDQPSSYPCNVCQPVLREAGNDFDGGSTKGTGAVLQFCALADILQSSEDTTQRLYNDAGWGKGVNPCKGWKGVECKDGKISRL